MIVATKYRDIRDMRHFLQGGILGGRQPQNAQTQGFLPLEGLTLVFLAPAGTCTFAAGADPRGLTAQEVLAQLQAALPTVTASWLNGCLALLMNPPGTPAVSLAGTGTANGFFGFASGSATTGKFVNNLGGAAPAFMAAYTTPDNSHVVLTWE